MKCIVHDSNIILVTTSKSLENLFVKTNKKYIQLLLAHLSSCLLVSKACYGRCHCGR